MTSAPDHWRGLTIPLEPGQMESVASGEPVRAPAAPSPPQAAPPLAGAPDDAAAPRLVQPAIRARLPPAVANCVGGAGAAVRTELRGLLGQGTSGRVYALQDHSLGRLVAIKCLQHSDIEDPQAVARIIDEARLTASLSHPNVLPIYDLDLDEHGCAYFTMKHIDGRALGSIIASSSRERRDERLASPAAVVAIFIGVAQALAYAHRQGVIHQDIKPDNIMVGAFGEVLVVDWGCAVRLEDAGPPRLYGTPLYMSPEQAQARASDRRSDVYCIGASLFHALLLRPPTWAESPEEFWRLKREGVVQPPAREERRAMPAALRSILARALEQDPARRYQDAGALLADLCAWRDGERVDAHRESARERFGRLHRRHGRRAWLALAAASSLLALLVVLFGERLQEYARWGGPAVVEDFADDSWSKRWIPGMGSYHRDGDALVSGSGSFNTVWLDRICPGATAIEYDADIAPGVWPGDIGAVWSPDARLAASGHKLITPTWYMFKFGAFAGGFTMIARDHVDERGQVSDEAPLAYSPQRLIRGRSYHVRAQVADNRLDLWVDGVLVATWRDPFAFASGRIGLSSYEGGKQYRHVRVYIRGVAQKVPAIAVGDALVQEGDWLGAQREYARVAASFPGSGLEREAVFREGVCAYRQGDLEQARALWLPLRGSDRDAQVQLQDVDALVSASKTAAAIAAMRALAPDLDHDQLMQLAIEWNTLVGALIDRKESAAYASCLELHDQIFSGEPVVDYTVCRMLMLMGRYDDILARYPSQRYACAAALNALERNDEVVSQYPDQPVPYTVAAFHTGQFELMQSQSMSGLRWAARLMRGEGAAIIGAADAPPEIRFAALLQAGRLEEAKALKDLPAPSLGLVALAQGKPDLMRALSPALYEYALGDPAKAMALDPGNANFCRLAKDALVWRRADPKDPAAAARIYADDHAAVGDYCIYFEHFLLAPFLLERFDHAPRMDAIFARIRDKCRYLSMQSLWYDAGYFAGTIGVAEFRTQPNIQFADARLALLDAMRADRGSDRTTALAGYRAWLALPFWKRSGTPYIGNDGLVAWRITLLEAQLGAASP